MDENLPATPDERTSPPPTAAELRLVKAAEECALADAAAAGTVAYLPRMMVQATMPHSRPDVNEFTRTNGNLTVHMMAPMDVGLPYGGQPRVLLAYLTKQAVKTKSRVISLGRSRTEFRIRMRKASDGGGERGQMAALERQMRRLFATSIRSYERTRLDGRIFERARAIPPLITEWERWWSPRTSDQESFFESTITLGEEFYRSVIDHPVPVDMRVMFALVKSPLALDLYAGFTHRASYNRRDTEIPWLYLQRQYGAEYKRTADFRRKAIRALEKIKLYWPELDWTEDHASGLFVLRPCKPHVPASELLLED